MMKRTLVLGTLLLLTLATGARWTDFVACQRAQAWIPAKQATQNVFLFGESIEKKGEPRFGINIDHIDWWLGEADGRKLRRLDDPKLGRAKIRLIDRTVILHRDDDNLTLLGRDGGNVKLSLRNGPLARASIHDPGQVTTFSYAPDGKAVYFANARGTLCRIDLKTKQLAVFEIQGVNPGIGVHFSPRENLMAYGKYRQGKHQVYVAKLDGTGEKQLTEYADGAQLGFGFLPTGHIGVVGPREVRSIDPQNGQTKVIASWKKAISFRSFGGFNPDGSTFIYDLGGPYLLRLFSHDMKTGVSTVVQPEYLESFQQMVWARVTTDR